MERSCQPSTEGRSRRDLAKVYVATVTSVAQADVGGPCQVQTAMRAMLELHYVHQYSIAEHDQDHLDCRSSAQSISQ